jgi:hypothetical protein
MYKLFSAYYQWTPFILLGMAFLFLLPRFLWHSCTGRSGVNIKRLVIAIKEKNEEDKGIKLAQTVLQLFLDAQFESKQTLCWPCNIPKCYFGYTLSYISIKILYLINSIIQFILLHKFLSFEFTNYGWQALQKMLSGEQLFESPTFPRVTMCDFMVRRLGSNVHWYSVQCNLPFNMYNEKIFFGIWLWLIILIISNFISIISWVISLRPSVQLATINRYLKISLILEIRTGNATNTMKTETRDFKKTEVKDGTPTTTTDKQTITTREENSATTTGEGKRTVTTRKENRTVTVRENTGDVITTEENETVTTQQQDPEDNPQSGCDITSTGKGPFLNYLTMDGYLFFLLIERNTDEITAAKILKYLYKKRAHGLSMTNRLLQD